MSELTELHEARYGTRPCSFCDKSDCICGSQDEIDREHAEENDVCMCGIDLDAADTDCAYHNGEGYFEQVTCHKCRGTFARELNGSPRTILLQLEIIKRDMTPDLSDEGLRRTQLTAGAIAAARREQAK
jgi:hypothetical protein